jgi:hypothetical protein
MVAGSPIDDTLRVPSIPATLAFLKESSTGHGGGVLEKRLTKLWNDETQCL